MGRFRFRFKLTDRTLSDTQQQPNAHMDIRQQGHGATAAAVAAGTEATVEATVGVAVEPAVGLPHIMCGQSVCTHTHTQHIVANAVGY